MNIIYRVQDDSGRGPYRPGTSHRWKDNDHDARNPTFFTEFGIGVVDDRKPGEAMGCAFLSLGQFYTWFSPAERTRLRLIGYRLCRMTADRIVAKSDRQVVFTRMRPLRKGATVLSI